MLRRRLTTTCSAPTMLLVTAVLVMPALVAPQRAAAQDVTTVPAEPANARDVGPPELDDAASTAEPAADAPAPSHWQSHWDRFHPLEGIVTILAESTAIAIYFSEPSRTPRWRDPMPLDAETRDALRLDDLEGQKLALDISDYMFFPMLVWPMALDALLLAGIVGGDWDTAWQMIMIDAEALAIAHLVTWATTRLVGRVRPRHLECTQDDSCGDRGVGPVASFVSGHSLMAYAASGLTCVHHTMNPWLTGSVEGAVAICATSLAVATTVSVLRVMTDLHWASDVAFGGIIGTTIGWGIPLIFHYGRFRPRLPGDIAIVPAAAGDVGLGAMGRF